MSNRAKLLLKALISVALLWYLASRMDLRHFGSILLSASLPLIFLATAIQAGLILLAVYRWQVILANFKIRELFSPLTKIMFIGSFFNLFLPSAIGGDFFRAYYLSKRKRTGMSTTLTTTVLERSAGLFALLTIGTVCSALWRLTPHGVPLFHVFLGLILLYIGANVALFHPWFHKIITQIFCRWNLKDVEAKLGLVYSGLTTLRRNRRAILLSLGCSFVIQFVAVVIMWIAALSIQVRGSFYVFLVFIPIVNLAIMVPLTINGFGLRETVYALLFSEIGVSQETAVALSLLNFIIVTLASLPGAWIYSFYKKEEGFDAILQQAEAGEVRS